MLKKMRRRFISAAMAAFLAVVLALVIGINLWNFGSITSRLDETISQLQTAGKNSNGFPQAVPGRPFVDLPNNSNPEAGYMTRFFGVECDGSGTVISSSMDFIASISTDDLSAYAKGALSSGSDRGFIDDYRYSVLAAENGENYHILFLNAANELSAFRTTLVVSALVALASLVVVFFLVLIFSGKAIKPYALNIEKQKRFITDASHELKTPLTSISASVDVIECKNGADEWTDNVHFQIGRMTHLVENLVTLSRMDEASPLPSKSEFSLSEAAWEVSDTFRTRAAARNAEYIQNIENEITLFGEKTSVQQLISCLLDNATKYVSEGGKIVFDVYKTGAHVRIDVFNSCDAALIPDTSRLFDRFYRPDESRSTKTGGYGIGLSIAKAVAEAHGGSITAECPDLRSIIFKVTL